MSVEKEQPNKGVDVGDVWQSKGGKARVRVENIVPQYTGSSWMNVHWSSVNGSRKGTCGLHNFAASRTLVERDGKPVVAAPNVAKADAAARLANLRAWAANADNWDGYHVADVIEKILAATAPDDTERG